jgi:hypothetical protein
MACEGGHHDRYTETQSSCPAWRVGVGIAAAVALAVAASARTGGAIGPWSRSRLERIRRGLRSRFHRAEAKADRTGRHMQDAADVIGETAADLAHGPDPVSE